MLLVRCQSGVLESSSNPQQSVRVEIRSEVCYGTLSGNFIETGKCCMVCPEAPALTVFQELDMSLLQLRKGQSG